MVLGNTYYFHYDLDFDTPIRKKERKKISELVYGFIAEYCKESGLKIIGPKNYRVSLKATGARATIMVDKFLHLGVYLDKVNASKIDVFNGFVNRIFSFATTLGNRNIKSIDAAVEFQGKIDKGIVDDFVERKSVVELSSKLKTNVKSTAISFYYKRDVSETLVMFGQYRRNRVLNVIISRELKNAEWDVLKHGYEEINRAINEITNAVGVKVND